MCKFRKFVGLLSNKRLGLCNNRDVSLICVCYLFESFVIGFLRYFFLSLNWLVILLYFYLGCLLFCIKNLSVDLLGLKGLCCWRYLIFRLGCLIICFDLSFFFFRMIFKSVDLLVLFCFINLILILLIKVVLVLLSKICLL